MVPVLVATVSVSVELFSMTAERGASNSQHSIQKATVVQH